VGPPQRRLLCVALQHRRLEPGGTVAHLHPTCRGRSRVSHPEKRALDPPDLASAGRPRQGPHPRLLSSLTCSGRRWSSGSAEPAWARARGPSSTNSVASRAPMSCCPPSTGARTCACAAWSDPIEPKLPCWTASGWTCRSGCASGQRSPPPRKCSGDFCRKSAISRPRPPRTAEVGLAFMLSSERG